MVPGPGPYQAAVYMQRSPATLKVTRGEEF